MLWELHIYQFWYPCSSRSADYWFDFRKIFLRNFVIFCGNDHASLWGHWCPLFCTEIILKHRINCLCYDNWRLKYFGLRSEWQEKWPIWKNVLQAVSNQNVNMYLILFKFGLISLKILSVSHYCKLLKSLRCVK
jgi:hypothetical protein